MRTEFEFDLPRGYLDGNGNIHRRGAMRMATVMDEIGPVADPQLRSNEAYLSLIILSNVITRLGPFDQVTPEMLEGFFTVDVLYLQTFYNYINGLNDPYFVEITCPHCGHDFEAEIPALDA